ncbi:MAG TPA: SelB C-terminal domain-containing protein, partial [Candidatus Deferrimicrobium sp.]|nr:SelB C-terminal domain-containing protein [Candidatus Deferrimicrobium sp.]
RRMSEFEYLTRRVSGHVRDLVLTELEKRVIVLMDRLLEDADVASSDVDRVAASLVDEGSAARFEQYVFERDTLARATEHCEETMAEYLSHRPHLTGVTVEQLARLSGFSNDTINGLVAYLLVADRMTRTGEKYDLVGRAVSLKGPIKEAHQSIMQSLNAQPYAPPSLSALAAGGRHHKEAIKYIIDSGAGYKCGSEFLFLSKVWNEIVEFIKTHLNGAGTLTVGDLKERFGFTRKFAIPILEETDRLKLTRRDGDIRVKGDWFDKQESAV